MYLEEVYNESIIKKSVLNNEPILLIYRPSGEAQHVHHLRLAKDSKYKRDFEQFKKEVAASPNKIGIFITQDSIRRLLRARSKKASESA